MLGDKAPEVLVVDLTLPAGAHADVWSALGESHPAERSVGLIPPGGPTEALVRRGYRAGLGGLLVADDDIGNGNLSYTVRQVAAGNRCYGPAAQTVLMERVFAPGPRGADFVPYLTERELEVARPAARGLRREIAGLLSVSEPTVKTHMNRVRKKLGLRNARDWEELRRRLQDLDLLNGPDEVPADLDQPRQPRPEEPGA